MSKVAPRASDRQRRAQWCKLCSRCWSQMPFSLESFSLEHDRNDEARMTKDEGMEINNETLMTDDEGMTRLRAATARQAKFGNPKARAEDSFWGGNSNAVLREEPEPEHIYDLEERTARFGQAV